MGRRPPLQSLWLHRFARAAGWVLAGTLAAALAGCQKPNSTQINYQMGEPIIAGPITYNVVQTSWRTQLGDLLTTRVPDNRFLLISLTATNHGNREVSVPFLTLEGPDNKTYRELENGQGVDNWFGLVRNIQPAETRQGNLAFDVPLTSYRLRLTDGGEVGSEKFVWVEIPLRLDTDTSISTPTPGVK